MQENKKLVLRMVAAAAPKDHVHVVQATARLICRPEHNVSCYHQVHLHFLTALIATATVAQFGHLCCVRPKAWCGAVLDVLPLLLPTCL